MKILGFGLILFMAVFIVGSLSMTSTSFATSLDNSEGRISYAKIVQLRVDQAIDVAGRAYRVEPRLIAAVIKAESAGREKAVSVRGARGLMQLMPDTARSLGVRDSFNIEQNVLGGTRYLRLMYDQFGSWRMALIAYNWGPGNLERYGADRMPRETRDYLVMVERFYGKQIN